MALLTGMTAGGLEVPVQVLPDGKLVAEGLEGPAGPAGPTGPTGATGAAGVQGATGPAGTPAALGGTALLPGLTPPNDPNTGIYSSGADQLAISTDGTERARFDATGKLLIGASVGTLGASYKIEVNGGIGISAGTAAAPGLAIVGDPNTGIFSPGADQLSISTNGVERIRVGSSGMVGIGGPALNICGIRFAAPLTGGASVYGYVLSTVVKSDATATAAGYSSDIGTEAAAFNLSSVSHFSSVQGVFGAGSTVTTQYGFIASYTLTGAVNNYGFYGDIPAGPKRWNFYAASTADNYFASHNFIFANGGAERARFESNGKLLIGRSAALAGSTAQLQTTGTLNITTTAHADNAAAKTAGLVAGDIYRKADGTLMITF